MSYISFTPLFTEKLSACNPTFLTLHLKVCRKNLENTILGNRNLLYEN